jgi:mxaD protein
LNAIPEVAQSVRHRAARRANAAALWQIRCQLHVATSLFVHQSRELIMKLLHTLAFVALAASSSVFAAAPELKVSKSVDIAASADTVWAKVKNFDGINAWHPAFVKDEIISGKNNVVGAQRLLTLGNGGTIKEKLLGFDDKNHTFKYEILEGVLPVSDYKSTFSVKSTGKNASTATWSATFKRKDTGDKPAATANDETATTAVTGAYQAGLDNLKKISEAKQRSIKKHDAIE